MSVIEDLSVDQLISPSNLRPAYQPIVDIATGSTVAYEALARWPTLGVDPGQAFEAAARGGFVASLDWACRTEALRGALEAGLGRERYLFVNSEPTSFAEAPPAGFADIEDSADAHLRVVMEITERALFRAPAELLRACRRMRERGWGLALDDVGAVPESLALLPFIAPDVIKLDIQLIQAWPDPFQAQIMAAVLAHAERSGATVLAEGIETEAHLDQALALGATLGQGWYYGRPGPISAGGAAAGSLITEAAPEPPGTPFALLETRADVRVARKGLLLGISRHLENQGLSLGIPPVVLAAFQSARRFTPATQARYARLAERCPLVAVFAEELSSEPAMGVRGATLCSDDPLCQEWTVAVVGAHYAGALIARDLGDDGPDLQRRFAFAITHDRAVVIQAATSMLQRVVAAGL